MTGKFLKNKTMEKLKKWWSVWGQFWGFIFMIVYLNGFWMIFTDEFQSDWRYPASWLIQFFSFAGIYAWMSRKYGWRLPKDIKDTH